jgi:hypothetical protein
VIEPHVASTLAKSPADLDVADCLRCWSVGEGRWSKNDKPHDAGRLPSANYEASRTMPTIGSGPSGRISAWVFVSQTTACPVATLRAVMNRR